MASHNPSFRHLKFVIPAKAGIQADPSEALEAVNKSHWIPTFAGMTKREARPSGLFELASPRRDGLLDELAEEGGEFFRPVEVGRMADAMEHVEARGRVFGPAGELG